MSCEWDIDSGSTNIYGLNQETETGKNILLDEDTTEVNDDRIWNGFVYDDLGFNDPGFDNCQFQTENGLFD